MNNSWGAPHTRACSLSNLTRGALQLVLFVIPLLLAGLTPALAQKDIRDNVTGFAPAYFAGARPATALEMVQLLPGFSLVEGNANVRGYAGAVGNVLIDGRPPASKADTLSDILKRIPAASVERLELMRPGAAGIDMQGYALLANVVRKASNAPRERVEVEYIQFGHGHSAPKLGGEFSIGSTQVFNFSGAVYRSVLNFFGYGSRNRYANNGSQIFLAEYNHPKIETGFKSSADYRQPLLGGNIRVNALVNGSRTLGEPIEKEHYPVLAESDGTEREIRNANEVGVQYTHGLWTGGDLETIGIHRSSSLNNTQGSVMAAGTNQVLTKSDTRETIVRAVERQRGANWNVQAGAELALNSLNNRISYQRLGVTVPLPSANVLVSERRMEFFGIGSWHVLPSVAVEAGARYEMSKLKQSGDANLTRDLSYLKPHALLTWDPTAKDEARLLYERTAGQLEFRNFVSSVQLSSGQVAGGNPKLLPYTQWRTELVWEHRFDVGSLVLTARQDAITNVLDRIAVTSAAGTLDASGNLPSGRRQEFVANLNMPLDWMMLDGVTVRASWLQRFSHVIDPVTGVKRSITGDAPNEASFDVIKDIPAIQMRWGLTYTHEVDRRTFRFNEFRRDDMPEQFDAFVEYKPTPKWLIRLFGQNLTDRPVGRIRDIYPGPRSTAVKSYTEWERQSTGPRVGLNVQRTFGGD